MLSVTEGYGVSSDWQQAIHDEQKDSVAKDEGHLESRPVHSLGRQQEAKEVNCITPVLFEFIFLGVFDLYKNNFLKMKINFQYKFAYFWLWLFIVVYSYNQLT